MAGMTAFREAYLHAGTLDDADFSSFAARQVRYEILWSFFDNTAYRKIHAWSSKLKADYGMYKYTRNIYNPAFRLGNFWQTHLMGGALGMDADGAQASGALPIVTDSAPMRLALGHLWRDSNWQANKDIYTTRGVVLGDTALRVVDDVERKKVYLQVVHPGTIADVTVDPFGNVKGYEIQETRADPRDAKRAVTYTETAERDGNDVVYATYLDNAPYAWNGEAAEWREPYGFIPLVLVQHNNVGLQWGWCELQPDLSKVREVDDIASKLSDHIRKYVDPVWLFSGLEKPRTQPAVAGSSSTATKPEPARDELPAIYTGNVDAKAQALVAALDIPGTLQHIGGIIEEMERDYPELKLGVLRTNSQTSGEALRAAMEPVEQKVQMRRGAYDAALVRAQQMAVAIGGWRGYDGYAGFNLDSYAAGGLEHAIGERAVFEDSPEDKAARELAFWQTARTAVEAKMPLTLWLKQQGWSDEKVAEVTNSPEYKALQAPAFG